MGHTTAVLWRERQSTRYSAGRVNPPAENRDTRMLLSHCLGSCVAESYLCSRPAANSSRACIWCVVRAQPPPQQRQERRSQSSRNHIAGSGRPRHIAAGHTLYLTLSLHLCPTLGGQYYTHDVVFWRIRVRIANKPLEKSGEFRAHLRQSASAAPCRHKTGPE